jgi:hypothetical protein
VINSSNQKNESNTRLPILIAKMNENQQPIRNNKILFGQKLSDE